MALLNKTTLQKSAGLLNATAPEDHFLAYITEGERDMLIQAGGKETATKSGIKAYPGGAGTPGGYQGDWGGGNDSGGNDSGGNDHHPPGPSDPTPIQTATTPPEGPDPHGGDWDEGWLNRAVEEANAKKVPIGHPEWQESEATTAIKPNATFETSFNDGRPTITHYVPDYDSKISKYNSKTTLNQIKHIQDTKLDSVKAKLRKNGYDIPEDANFAETKAFINDLSNDELPDSYKDLKDKNGDPLYDQATIDKWEEIGYMPEGGSMTMPGIGGAILNKFDKQLTRDELWADLDQATEVGNSADMSFTERMKTYSPNQYAAYTGQSYDPMNKTFSSRDDGGSEQAAVERVTAPYQVGQTTPLPSQAAQWYANLGGSSGGFNLTSAYAAAKSKVAQTLGNPSAVGQLAVNQSPFYDWLKKNSLNKGIL